MLVGAPVVRPLVNFSAIPGLETIVFQIETAVGVHDFVGTVAVLREAPEFVCGAGPVVMPLIEIELAIEGMCDKNVINSPDI